MDGRFECPPYTLGVRSWRGTSRLVVGEQMGDEGNTAAACGGRCTGFSGVSGGDGERDWRMSEGRNFLSRRRSGGVNGGRVVVGDGIRGVVGDPGGGKSLRAYLMRFLTLDGRAESLCFRRRCSRNRVRHATSRRPRAELSAMATLVPVASSVSVPGVVVAVAEMLGEFEEPRLVSAAAGALLLALPIVGAPLCVASTAVEVCAAPPAAADHVCAGNCRSVHSATEPSTMFASVIHV